LTAAELQNVTLFDGSMSAVLTDTLLIAHEGSTERTHFPCGLQGNTVLQRGIMYPLEVSGLFAAG
jgi:hypothetical protein